MLVFFDDWWCSSQYKYVSSSRAWNKWAHAEVKGRIQEMHKVHTRKLLFWFCLHLTEMIFAQTKILNRTLSCNPTISSRRKEFSFILNEGKKLWKKTWCDTTLIKVFKRITINIYLRWSSNWIIWRLRMNILKSITLPYTTVHSKAAKRFMPCTRWVPIAPLHFARYQHSYRRITSS